jgi:hypothetical protein
MIALRRTRSPHPTLVTPKSGPGRERSGWTRYLEVCDLGSVSELWFRSYLGARFYEGPGASACNERTSDPVET